MTLAAKSRHTDEQRRAISTRGNSVGLSAGAGCGKTFVLTERFLDELEPRRDHDPPPLDELVAITFTDAAARELRDRIRAKCRERIESAPSGEATYWRRLSRSIDTARISTIHAFCGAVLRQHAFDLGLDPGFTVLEAGAARTIENSVFSDLLRDQLASNDPAAVRVAVAWGVDGVRSRLRSLLPAFCEDTAGQWLDMSPTELIATWRANYDERLVPELFAEIWADSAIRIMRDNLPLVQPQDSNQVATRDRIATLLTDRPADGDIVAWVTELTQQLSFRGGLLDRTRWPDPVDYQVFKSAADRFKKSTQVLAQIDWSADEVAKAAALGLDLLAVAERFRKLYAAEKESRNALDFDDLLDQMHQLVTEPRFAPIVESLQSGIHLLMVDEFQDTDPRQVDILRRLVGDGLDSGRLFFVGDSKQSIYRFRGAEPKVFDDLRRQLPDDGRLPLSKNFRSQPAIIDFVNGLFSETFAEYQPLRASREQTTPEPAVELLWAEYPEQKHGGGNEWPVSRQRLLEARRIAARLRELIDDGSQIVGCEKSAEHPSGRRAAEQRDIAVLFRALSDVRYYEEALREQGLDYYLVGGRAFYAQQEVHDVLHLLRTVASECDTLSLVGTLRSPWFGVADETLVRLSFAGDSLALRLASGSIPADLPVQEVRKVSHAATVLAELRSLKDTISPAELLERACDMTGYDAVQVGEFLGERKLANLEKLIEMARTAYAAGVGSLDEFISQLADFTQDPPHEPPASTSGSDDNVVRLMTIHQAKGLEFPVVVVADVNRRAQPERDVARLDADLGPVVSLGDDVGDSKKHAAARILAHKQKQAARAELDRQFYVACTRAADYLILSSAMCKYDGTGGPWVESLASRFDLQSGRFLGIDRDVTTLRVNRSDKVLSPKSRASERRHLGQALAEARDSAPPLPTQIAPLPVRPSERRRFSVTRLSGEIVGERPRRGFDEEAAAPLDPLGFGTLVHAVLERVDINKPDEAAHWATRLATYHDLLHAVRAAEEATQLAADFCIGPLGREIASSPEVRREVEFLLPWRRDGIDKPLMLRGYLDLLYRDSGGRLQVVDYKTNRVAAAAVSQEAAKYELQMHLYALVVERTLGEPPAGMHLAFLRPQAIFAYAWDDAARRRAIQLVDRALDRALADETT